MRTFPLLLIAILLCACGQTGDLYLPRKTPEPTPVDQPTPEEKKKTVQPLQTEPAPPVQQ